MSEHDEGTSNVRVVAADTGKADVGLAAVASAVADLDGGPGDVHVITLRGADGWQLDHPAAREGDLSGCAVREAAGRISRAMCATLGRWTCDVQGGGLMLVERLGD